MPGENEQKRAEQETRKALYETQDAKVTSVLMVGLFIVVVLVGVGSGGWWMYQHYESRSKLVEAPYPQETAPAQPLPPEPRLQVWPAQDMREMRTYEERVLTSYGWVDQGRGIARIPIEKAMTLVAERGLAVAPPQSGEMLREQKELQPSGWSSGRVWERMQP